MIFYKKISKTIFLVILFGIFFIETPGFSQEKPIARLAGFSGTVLISSRGSWDVKPAKDLHLYSMDKVVTRIGNATIIFNDGAILDIKSNSNLLIQEREKKKGLIKIIERRILLFLGKFDFKTGKSTVETRFETVQSVIGIKVAAGILSVGSDGQIYVEFTEGGAKFTVGDLILGKVAEDVPTEVIDQNSIQKAAYMAHAERKRCGNAKEASKGEISPAQREWICAYAMEMSSREVRTWAEALVQYNPSEDVVEWAKEIILREDISIEKAKRAQKQAVESGATRDPMDAYTPPEAEGYEEPEAAAENFEPVGKTGGDAFSDPLPQDDMPNSPVGSNL
jgi:hypothetical protein